MINSIKKSLNKERLIFLKNRLWNLAEKPEHNLSKRFQHRVGIIDNILLGKAYGNVLEVGCGGGRFLIKVKSVEGVTSMWGLDISAEAVSMACKRGFNVIKANGEKLPFKNEAFDAVMSANGSPKEMNMKLLLSEAYNVLRPGGFFAFDTYNKYPLEKIVKHKIMYFLRITNKPYEGIAGGIESIKEFKKTCLKAGFEIILLFTLFPLPFFPYGILLKGDFFSRINTHLIGVLKKIK